MTEPNFVSKNFSATAAPAANVCPCPSGPEVFSIPLVTSRSGCPVVGEPHCLKFLRSSIENLPWSANVA